MAERKDSVSLRLVRRNEEASHRVVVGEHSRQGPLGPEGLAKVSEGEKKLLQPPQIEKKNRINKAHS